MKIVLLDDYSSFHFNLKLGFEELGHEVKLFSTGDGWKDIPGLRFPKSHSLLGKLQWEFLSWRKFSKQIFEWADYVQLMHVNTFLWSPRLYRFSLVSNLNVLERDIHSYQAKLGVVVAGCSFHVHQAFNEFLKERAPCSGCKELDLKQEKCIFQNAHQQQLEMAMYEMADKIICGGGEAYLRALNRWRSKTLKIPFLIHNSLIADKKSIAGVSGKIKVLHGVNRVGFKGSNYILSALEFLKKDSRFDIKIVERLKFTEYLKAIDECDIVVDQLFGDGLGYNALLSLARGKIVLTSYELSAIRHFYATDCPAIRTISIDCIIRELLRLAELPSSRFKEIKVEGIDFVQKECAACRVADIILSSL